MRGSQQEVVEHFKFNTLSDKARELSMHCLHSCIITVNLEGALIGGKI